LFKVILISGKTFAESTLNDFAFKLDVPLINWFIDKVILSGDTMQIIAQVAIVVIEILIGLALIGGLFTFPSSAVSLVLQLMFVTTTGLYLGTFWMIFAGIAVLFGAGQVLGLDYYVMPFLKDKWSKTKLARKSYLYND
ncbi:MAG: pyridine nucleotide-disulfide oxidoreductase, partial [Clostridia bacterium]|nr:pyridine nucleotide-disulfide oxidoreductase [Clostridia bacterium]